MQPLRETELDRYKKKTYELSRRVEELENTAEEILKRLSVLEYLLEREEGA